ncbi:MAG: hypothetical protein H0U81_07055 [Pyrinomonadaceae bacterium]|nr:hypothetical protein [Pyrinomonadaceae bacterium]
MKVWASVLFIALQLLGGQPLAVPRASSQAGAEDRVYTPEKGTPDRKAILDAVRGKLKTDNQFEVDHLKVNHRWAYFRGNAVVFTEREKVETDSVQALLERRNVNGKSAWMVLEIWNLEQGGTEDQFKQFVGRVSKRRKTEGIPGKIFPEQL